MLFLSVGAGCSNRPFTGQNATDKVRFLAFDAPPKTLDPAISYTAGMSSDICSAVYETLLGYHYLKRPYELIPGLAKSVPDAVVNEDGSVSYRFEILEGVRFHEDRCFSPSGTENMGREMTAYDFEFEFKRTADSENLCPVISALSNIRGYREFREHLKELREASQEFCELPINEQYEKAGPIAGIVVLSPYDLEIILKEPYPQILYWLAMPFTAAVPWEAIVHYDGKEGRSFFKDHPVGTGPYYLAEYDKEYRVVLQRNDQWYGFEHPEWQAPSATYPSEGTEDDRKAGLLSDKYVGRPLAFIERFEYRRDKESTSYFSKFIQGYYDRSGIAKERFDQVVVEGGLSEEMKARGIIMSRGVEPTISYMGFNMEDSVLGDPAGERGKKLRQAMSLVVDTKEYNRIFANGRGIPAQSPIPPEIFGYDAGYTNQYRQVNVARAKEILAEAGYPKGIDPDTGKPLRLTYDVMGTSSAASLAYQFYINSWRSLGLNVELAATDYNQFSEKVRNGAYQIFMWGWNADYPDPENFLFLLWSEMARSKNGGPNSANYQSERYDQLFDEMNRRVNDDKRYQLCREMVSLLEDECPWIPLSHSEVYALQHSWVYNVKSGGLSISSLKYQDVDPAARDIYQKKHNHPIVWPLYIMLSLFLLAFIPAVITFLNERQ